MAEKKTYRCLCAKDRKYIEKVYKSMTLKEIANGLGCNYGTISKELKRCPPGNYSAKLAQMDCDRKKTRGGPKAPVKSYWQRLVLRKQMETCIRMQPTVDLQTITRITGIEEDKAAYYYEDIKREIITQ